VRLSGRLLGREVSVTSWPSVVARSLEIDPGFVVFEFRPALEHDQSSSRAFGGSRRIGGHVIERVHV
jgi:hypothetical protein